MFSYGISVGVQILASVHCLNKSKSCDSKEGILEGTAIQHLSCLPVKSHRTTSQRLDFSGCCYKRALSKTEKEHLLGFAKLLAILNDQGKFSPILFLDKDGGPLLGNIIIGQFYKCRATNTTTGM